MFIYLFIYLLDRSLKVARTSGHFIGITKGSGWPGVYADDGSKVEIDLPWPNSMYDFVIFILKICILFGKNIIFCNQQYC